jgi:type II secretory pathway predicted ATPase ExeA
MYKAYYSLSVTPFTKTIETKNLFKSSTFNETIARLNYLLKTRGIGLITSEAGCGKTTALRAFKDSLNDSLYKVIYFPFSSGTVKDFYRGIALLLGEEPKFRKVDLFNQIQSSISTLFYKKKITPVIILDEMQLAKNGFLNDLSLLLNFSMDSRNPYILIIAGLPHLTNRMRLNSNQSLNQRITMRYQINPLDKVETNEYINHHLELANASYQILNKDAIEAIAINSRGIPRLINNLVTHALIRGATEEKETIDAETIYEISKEVGI